MLPLPALNAPRVFPRGKGRQYSGLQRGARGHASSALRTVLQQGARANLVFASIKKKAG